MQNFLSYLPLLIFLTLLVVAIVYMRRPGKAPPSKTWLDPRAFVFATLLMAFVQLGKLSKAAFTPEAIVSAVFTCFLGGVFWGAIGTYIYNRSRRQP